MLFIAGDAFALTQIRRPTGDGTVNGAWTYSSGTTGWNLVDESAADDADYFTCPISGSPYFLFTFPVFNVPTGATINSLAVTYRGMDVSNGTNRINARLTVDGSGAIHVTNNDNPGSSFFTTYTKTWTTNPITTQAWTADEINGVAGATELQQFGVYHSDCNPQIRTSWVYATVDYTTPLLQSSAIDSSGEIITLTFNEAVTFGAGGNGGWTIDMSGGSGEGMSYSSGSGSTTLVYTITGRVIQSGETGTVSYTQPGNGAENSSGDDLATIASSAVTNNSSQGGGPSFDALLLGGD